LLLGLARLRKVFVLAQYWNVRPAAITTIANVILIGVLRVFIVCVTIQDEKLA
jgi:hypothetical protein